MDCGSGVGSSDVYVSAHTQQQSSGAWLLTGRRQECSAGKGRASLAPRVTGMSIVSRYPKFATRRLRFHPEGGEASPCSTVMRRVPECGYKRNRSLVRVHEVGLGHGRACNS